MASDMQIEVSQQQGRAPVTIFHIKGEIDINSYEELQTQADRAFEASMRNLLLDLSQVSYVSSAGLRAIHHIFTLLRADTPEESEAATKKGLLDGTFKSPHLKLLNPSPEVRQTLSTAGFDMFLEIHKDLKKAVASF